MESSGELILSFLPGYIVLPTVFWRDGAFYFEGSDEPIAYGPADSFLTFVPGDENDEHYPDDLPGMTVEEIIEKWKNKGESNESR